MRIVFVLCLIAVIAIASSVTLHLLSRPSLSHPISANDILIIDEDYTVRVGDAIFGYEAPLENYISVFNFQKNDKDSIFEWGTRGDVAKYHLYLRDEDGALKGVVFMRRISENAFSATSSLYLGGGFFEDYMSAVTLIENHCTAKGISIYGFRPMMINDGEIMVLLADTSSGVIGVTYEMVSHGGLFWPFTGNTPPEYDFSPTLLRVAEDQELRDLFLLVSR